MSLVYLRNTRSSDLNYRQPGRSVTQCTMGDRRIQRRVGKSLKIRAPLVGKLTHLPSMQVIWGVERL
jgi:hypothetical protein